MYIRNTAFALILIAIGTGIGYTMTPTKTVTVTKVVEKIVVQRDVTTVTERKPDGTETTTITDHTREHTDTIESGRTETTKSNKNWAVSGAYLSGMDGKREIVGSLSRRIVGEVYVGVFASSEGRAGVGVTVRF